MRILLAEDERSLSRVLVTIFQKNNYSVDAVYNGEDALAYLQSDNYDVAVLDIMMPVMDGITVLKKVRASGNQLPILMLTAKSEVDDKVLGMVGVLSIVRFRAANDKLRSPVFCIKMPRACGMGHELVYYRTRLGALYTLPAYSWSSE